MSRGPSLPALRACAVARGRPRSGQWGSRRPAAVREYARSAGADWRDFGGARARAAQTMPDKPRPFKIPLSTEKIPYFCFFPVALCVLLIVIAEMRTHIIGAVGLLIAYVAFKTAVAVKGDASNLIAMDELDEM